MARKNISSQHVLQPLQGPGFAEGRSIRGWFDELFQEQSLEATRPDVIRSKLAENTRKPSTEVINVFNSKPTDTKSISQPNEPYRIFDAIPMNLPL